MVMTILVSTIITPVFIWLLLYFKITDQYTEVDDKLLLVETKAEAQKDVFIRTIKSPWLYLYLLYALIMSFAGACSVNAFGLGDWFFSL